MKKCKKRPTILNLITSHLTKYTAQIRNERKETVTHSIPMEITGLTAWNKFFLEIIK